MMFTRSTFRMKLTLLILYGSIVRCSSFLGVDVENVFTNWHISIDVGGEVMEIHRPKNNVTGANGVQSIDFLGGLQQLKDFVGQVPDGKRIRAYGSKWSMSNISFVNDILIETEGLNYCKIGIDDPATYLTTNYQEKSNLLAFVQTGVMVKHLSSFLKESDLSLSTTGGSDGQRLVGAIATGTHGSTPHYGAMGEFVRGIHIVVSNTDHYFVQKETDPVVQSAYVNDILDGAVLVESNDLFEAMSVGLGSFGIIHALLIEVEPMYLLRTQYKVVHYNDIKNNVASLDVTPFKLDGIAELPHWFQIVVNPYNLNRVYVAAAEKIPFPGTSAPARLYETNPEFFQNETLIEDPAIVHLKVAEEEMTWLRYLDDNFRGVFGLFIGNLLKRITYSKLLDVGLRYYHVRLAKNTDKSHATIFQQPGSGNTRQPSLIPTTEMEIAVPVERVTEVVDLWIEIAKRRPILQTINVRYVKKLNATLAFTRFNMTATVSMFGMWSDLLFHDVEDIYFEIMEAMAATTIPHCWHWGKKQPPTSDWIINSCYGRETRDAWMQQREAFLPDPGIRDKFSSDALEFLGLHS